MLPFLVPLLSPNHPHPPTTSGGPGGYLIQGSLRLHRAGRGGRREGQGHGVSPAFCLSLEEAGRQECLWLGDPGQRSEDQRKRRSGARQVAPQRSSSWCLLRAGLTQNALRCHLAISAHFAALPLSDGGVGGWGRNALVSPVNTLMHLDSTT